MVFVYLIKDLFHSLVSLFWMIMSFVLLVNSEFIVNLITNKTNVLAFHFIYGYLLLKWGIKNLL